MVGESKLDKEHEDVDRLPDGMKTSTVMQQHPCRPAGTEKKRTLSPHTLSTKQSSHTGSPTSICKAQAQHTQHRLSLTTKQAAALAGQKDLHQVDQLHTSCPALQAAQACTHEKHQKELPQTHMPHPQHTLKPLVHKSAQTAYTTEPKVQEAGNSPHPHSDAHWDIHKSHNPHSQPGDAAASSSIAGYSGSLVINLWHFCQPV